MSALSPVARAILRNPSGRAANTGVRATVFGCSGFLGRYLCAEIGKHGNTIVAPYRGDEMEVRHIKLMADVGNVALVPFNPRDKESVRYAVTGSDVVINLIGKHYETKHFLPWWINYTYDDVHVEVARTIAEVCAEEKVPRMIHVSSLMAAPNSPSLWAASKFRGEMAVRKAFPGVNIVRPAYMYGTEDKFLTWIADRMYSGGAIIVDNGEARVQPVFVNDVAQGIYNIMRDTEMHGKTFEFAGDEEYTFKEVVDYVFDVAKHPPNIRNLPLPIAKALGWYMEKWPAPLMNYDHMIQMTLDQVKTSTLPGLREVDITPKKMEKEAATFLLRYNRGGHFQEISGYH